MNVIGGDGTHIGVTTSKTNNLTSIWRPETDRHSVLKWGRASRRPASFITVEGKAVLNASAVAIGSDVSKACTFAVKMLRDNKKKAMLGLCDIDKGVSCIPSAIRIELIRWYAGLTIVSSQWRPLQQLLLSAVSSESISVAFPVDSISNMLDLLTLNSRIESDTALSRQKQMDKFILQRVKTFEKYSMTVHVMKLVESQVQSSECDGRMLPTSFNLIHFLGKCDMGFDVGYAIRYDMEYV